MASPAPACTSEGADAWGRFSFGGFPAGLANAKMREGPDNPAASRAAEEHAISMSDGTQSHGWVFYLGLGLSLTIHGGVAVYLLSRQVADFGATDVTTTAISVNIEATDIVDAAEQSAATDAARGSASRPAPASDAEPEQADSPEPARAETVPPQSAPETAQAEAMGTAQAPTSRPAPAPDTEPEKADTPEPAPTRAETVPPQSAPDMAQAEATDAAHALTSRPAPAPAPNAEPEQADTPEPAPARAETIPSQSAPETEQAALSEPPAGQRAGEAAASREDEAAPRALNAVREKDEATRRDRDEAAQSRAATERRAARAKQADKQTKHKRTPRAANAEASGAGGAKASAGRVSASQGAMQTYKGVLDAWMARHKPAYAGGRGRVEMLIALSSSGALISASIVASSGNRALDQAALGAARRASPYPKPPPGSTDAQRRFRVPFASN